MTNVNFSLTEPAKEHRGLCPAFLARLAGVALSALIALSHVARAEPTCPPSRLPPVALPHLRQILASTGEVVVVAIGSSSTQGWRASDARHTYPAVLQSELSRLLPHAHVVVLNRGIGGQDAAEEVPRLESDALEVQPTLVIWQVGANGALHHTDPVVFRRLVEDGVEHLEHAGADVVLMDNQRAPMILASAEHKEIEQALADVAAGMGVGVFGRGALMDSWQAQGWPYAQFIAADGLHHNDFGYRCVAEAVAKSIAGGLETPVAGQASAQSHGGS